MSLRFCVDCGMQSMFIAWGFLTAGGFVLAGYKIVTALGAVGDAPNGARNGRGNNPRRTIITVTTISSALSAGYSVANIYVLVDTQTATNANANPWPWFICASSLRLLECIMSLSLWHIVTGGSGDRCTAMALFCCPIDKRKRSTNVHVDVGVKQIGYEKSEGRGLISLMLLLCLHHLQTPFERLVYLHTLYALLHVSLLCLQKRDALCSADCSVFLQ